MKPFFKIILKFYLKILARITLIIHRPTIIAIAGSANKTFVKDEIVRVLREAGLEAGSNPKSFNTEIGLPLAILGLKSGYNSYRGWLPIVLKAASAPFRPDFPEYLVLELGVSSPGDMKYLLSIIRPTVAIITEITQRYLESFNDMDGLVSEYEYLVGRMDEGRPVILNYDNPRIRGMRDKTRGQVIFYSIRDDSKAIGWSALGAAAEEDGQTATVSHGQDSFRVKIKKFGDHHLYALLAGLIVKDYVDQKKKF